MGSASTCSTVKVVPTAGRISTSMSRQSRATWVRSSPRRCSAAKTSVAVYAVHLPGWCGSPAGWPPAGRPGSRRIGQPFRHPWPRVEQCARVQERPERDSRCGRRPVDPGPGRQVGLRIGPSPKNSNSATSGSPMRKLLVSRLSRRRGRLYGSRSSTAATTSNTADRSVHCRRSR